ncbi:MAG: hypothetical protein HQK60_11015, partial [Deltaproteobacteria bacterium]|nr:hypothetical protein [Deltaproteobacteria bacterium]
SWDFGGHALALTLLGRYLAVEHGGDILKRDLIPQLISEERLGDHARRVMKAYEDWLQGRPELDILYVMGLFDRPAPEGAIDAIKAAPPIPGLTERLHCLARDQWQVAKNNLRYLRLLAPKSTTEGDVLDCHPLVREYFGERLKALNSTAWTEAHSRLYEYFKRLPKKEFPDTLEEMEPLYQAVGHGCRAVRYPETLDEVYQKQIDRGNEAFSTRKLGAYAADLAAVSHFFETPWTKLAK